jgi:hypothetical protein
VRVSLLLKWVTGLNSFGMLRRKKVEILGVDELVNVCLITKLLSNAPELNNLFFLAQFGPGGGNSGIFQSSFLETVLILQAGIGLRKPRAVGARLPNRSQWNVARRAPCIVAQTRKAEVLCRRLVHKPRRR